VLPFTGRLVGAKRTQQGGSRPVKTQLRNLTTLRCRRHLTSGRQFCSREALSAEVLFPRKQPAFYPERQVQARRLNDSARFSLILWSRLCNWKDAWVIVKPDTLIGWASQGFQGADEANRKKL
jgi:hypothetical protein